MFINGKFSQCHANNKEEEEEEDIYLERFCNLSAHLSIISQQWKLKSGLLFMRRKKLTERSKVLPSTYGDMSMIRPSSSAASKFPPSSCRQWQRCVGKAIIQCKHSRFLQVSSQANHLCIVLMATTFNKQKTSFHRSSSLAASKSSLHVLNGRRKTNPSFRPHKVSSSFFPRIVIIFASSSWATTTLEQKPPC